MRIRKPRNITGSQIVVATIIGILGGVYIWQPLLLRYRKQELSQKQTETVQVNLSFIISEFNYFQNAFTG